MHCTARTGQRVPRLELQPRNTASHTQPHTRKTASNGMFLALFSTELKLLVPNSIRRALTTAAQGVLFAMLLGAGAMNYTCHKNERTVI